MSDALEDYPHTRDWATDAARRVVEAWRSKGDGDNELQLAIAAVLREAVRASVTGELSALIGHVQMH